MCSMDIGLCIIILLCIYSGLPIAMLPVVPGGVWIRPSSIIIIYYLDSIRYFTSTKMNSHQPFHIEFNLIDVSSFLTFYSFLKNSF